MGRKGGGGRGSSHKSAPARAKTSPVKAAAKTSKKTTPPPPPPPPPVEEQIITPPEISVSPDPVQRTKQILRIPDLKSYEEEDYDESPTFEEDMHPRDCRCNCCAEY